VLILFTAARVLGGRPVGRLTKRQARAATAQSLRDRVRIDQMSSSGNRFPQEQS